MKVLNPDDEAQNIEGYSSKGIGSHMSNSAVWTSDLKTFVISRPLYGVTFDVGKLLIILNIVSPNGIKRLCHIRALCKMSLVAGDDNYIRRVCPK